MRVDLVTGAEPPRYTIELARGLPASIDCLLLPSKGYAQSILGTAYRWIDHPLAVQRKRREGSVLHIESLNLGYVLAWPMAPPTVLSCLDVVPLLREFNDPSYSMPNDVIWSAQSRLLTRGLLKAERVVAISQHVREDLLRLGCRASRVDVVPMGVNLQRFRLRTDADCRPVRAKYGIPAAKRLILFVGTEHPRKNLPVLFEAFARLETRQDIVLVKVGPPRQPQRSELLRLVSALDLNGNVLFLDHVAEEDLPLLYGTSEILVLPSLNEGFGLPPLEAMACGTPVAVSRVTALPEVVGAAGVYFDPLSIESLADALHRLVFEDGLREEMRARGLVQAAKFPSEGTVSGLVKTYEKASAGGS